MSTTQPDISIRLWSDGFCFTTPAAAYPIAVSVSRGEDYAKAITNHGILAPLIEQAKKGSQFMSVTFVDAPCSVWPSTFDDKQIGFLPQAHDSGVKLFSVPMPRSNATLSFSVDRRLADVFDGLTVTHSLAELAGTQYERVARLEDKCLSAVIRKNGELVFANQFRCSETADAAYHILNVYKQLTLDTAAPLYVIAPNSLTDTLNRFVNCVALYEF